jgi:Exostosin family
VAVDEAADGDRGARKRVLLAGHGTRPARMAAYARALDALEPDYLTAQDAADADIVLFAERGDNKFRSWRKVLEADPVFNSHAAKCFTYDFSDTAVTFLPGLYTCLERHRVDTQFAVAADYWREIEGPIEEELLGLDAPPRLLFSFRGFRSSPVRSRLFQLPVTGTDGRITETFQWKGYGEADADQGRREFLEEMRDSAFVLCPRGLAPASFRLYEAMYFGRVPVILSDELALAEGVPWEQFTIRVSEDEVASLPRLLESRAADAPAMGRAARDAWETYMRPGPTLMRRWLDAIVEMQQALDCDAHGRSALVRRWRSSSFQWENGIHPAQGVLRRLHRSTRRRGG